MDTELVQLEMLKAQFAGGIQLITHEDKLNWGKFNNLLYATLGLLAAYGLLARELHPANATGASPPEIIITLLMIISAFGLVLSTGFLITLRTGIRYLLGHKELIDSLESTHCGNSKICTFKQIDGETPKKGGSRFLLKWAPLACMALWAMFLNLSWLLNEAAEKNALGSIVLKDWLTRSALWAAGAALVGILLSLCYPTGASRIPTARGQTSVPT